MCYLEDGRVVYGAVLTDNGGLQTKHVRAPNEKFFSDFLQQFLKKHQGTISEFTFRNKSKCQGMTSAYKVKGNNGERIHL